jgi:hypothetical protein
MKTTTAKKVVNVSGVSIIKGQDFEVAFTDGKFSVKVPLGFVGNAEFEKKFGNLGYCNLLQHEIHAARIERAGRSAHQAG